MISHAAQLNAARGYAARSLQIRRLLGSAAVAAYDQIEDYSQIDAFLDQIVPLSLAAQKALATTLAGYLYSVTGHRPEPFDLDAVTGDALREDGARHDWSIPSFTMWAALGAGVAFADALAQARHDIGLKAQTNLAMTQSAAMARLAESMDEVSGYRRVLSGDGCDFCVAASEQRYKSDDLMPLHTGCMCSVAPILGRTDPARQLNAATLAEREESN